MDLDVGLPSYAVHRRARCAAAEEWRRARAEGMAVRPVASSFTDLLRLIISRRAYGLRTEYKSLSSWLLSCWAALEVPNMNVFD